MCRVVQKATFGWLFLLCRQAKDILQPEYAIT